MKEERLKIVEFCGYKLFGGTREEFADLLATDVKERKGAPKIVFSMNGEGLAESERNKKFKSIYTQADYIHADGESIILGTRIISKKPCKERIATTDWFHDVAKHQGCRQLKHFFFGGKPEVIERAVENVSKMYKHLRIAGYHHGYIEPSQESSIVDKVNKTGVDILWVGTGRPRQEKFSVQRRKELKVAWVKTCGGLFDFLSGNNPRAPKFMQEHCLEWAFRLYIEPKRLFSRYFKTNAITTAIIIREKIKSHSNR